MELSKNQINLIKEYFNKTFGDDRCGKCNAGRPWSYMNSLRDGKLRRNCMICGLIEEYDHGFLIVNNVLKEEFSADEIIRKRENRFYREPDKKITMQDITDLIRAYEKQGK